MSITPKGATRAQDVRELYDRDYYAWLEENAHAIREGGVHEIDWHNLAQELEDMGRSEKRALQSELARVMAHLLKWTYQGKRRRLSEHSWRATIDDAREKAADLLTESPSLRGELPELLPKAYRQAVRGVIIDTNLPETTFPPVCPWTLAQVMDENFWPEAATK